VGPDVVWACNGLLGPFVMQKNAYSINWPSQLEEKYTRKAYTKRTTQLGAHSGVPGAQCHVAGCDTTRGAHCSHDLLVRHAQGCSYKCLSWFRLL